MPVLVDGVYYSDGERCAHCYAPFPRQKRGGKTRRRSPICRACQRRHNPGQNRRGTFFFNSNCRACLETIPEDYSIGTP